MIQINRLTKAIHIATGLIIFIAANNANAEAWIKYGEYKDKYFTTELYYDRDSVKPLKNNITLRRMMNQSLATVTSSGLKSQSTKIVSIANCNTMTLIDGEKFLMSEKMGKGQVLESVKIDSSKNIQVTIMKPGTPDGELANKICKPVKTVK